MVAIIVGNDAIAAIAIATKWMRLLSPTTWTNILIALQHHFTVHALLEFFPFDCTEEQNRGAEQYNRQAETGDDDVARDRGHFHELQKRG